MHFSGLLSRCFSVVICADKGLPVRMKVSNLSIDSEAYLVDFRSIHFIQAYIYFATKGKQHSTAAQFLSVLNISTAFVLN